jgi:hypothetical protein
MIVINSIEEGRKQDGNRSIADKIIKRLHDLDKTVENNQGRWAWELLQNAKDSIAEEDDRTVSVQIELNEESVEFRHNGTYFTERDIRGLINQISSKEAEEGEHTKKTGRFGTGFLTTHMLSRVIQVKGIVKTESNDFYKFEFPLNRQGKTTSQLIPKIENAWAEFHNSAQIIDADYDQNKFNTSFCYLLETEEQKEIARIGLKEFSKLIPFVLAFIPKISCVDIMDNTMKITTTFKCNEKLRNSLITAVERTENEEKSEVLIVQAIGDRVTVATEVEKIEKGYSVKSIKNIPNLFCDFPLIGTENFHFPVIVNSFFFNPQAERDGIWLKSNTDDLEVRENQELLEHAVELYKNLISQITEQDFFDLYNLVETKMPATNDKYFDDAWYKEAVQKPIREFIFNAKIVELENAGEDRKSIKELGFPLKSYTETIQNNIWQFAFDLFPSYVCKKEHMHNWCKLSWDDWSTINYQALVNALAEQESVNKLSQSLVKDESDTFDWLNSMFKFILEDDTNHSLFEKSSIIPNQNGFFKKKLDVYIDEIENEELVNILKLLGDDWRDCLLNKNIKFGSYYPKNKKNIAEQITEKINKNHKDDFFKEAISRLSEWFDNHPELGKELFSELYSKRAELFMNIIEDKESLYKVMRSQVNLVQLSAVAQTLSDNPKLIQQVEELDSLLKEFNVSEVSDLKEMLESAKNTSVIISKINITQDTLLSLGVTSIEELEEALKDKHLSAQLKHTSTPTIEMFLYAQNLINRAKDNVVKHLEMLEEYDCSDSEALAPTVIGGIKKEGRSIYIVIRPSDNGQVIIYYGSEKDVLDSADAELWIDNGKDDPRHLTLGKILKKTGINKIPV